MLHQDISEAQRTDGGMTAEWEFARRHASEFIPGSVTFVGYGAWSMVVKCSFNMDGGSLYAFPD